ncbi:ABC transporter permease subunit [Nonomuraea soli]|uniref:ABC-type branched-subunit amino acid transport system ATPase component/ABC-type branched-subunit amino acid transport system permease subunit n=1 Tax=Nonomuraea soli TaxID=1032476 RepID=A0A7W0HPM9_9ACTN|nr:branched-chain amino acid ABC transporter ATP-binding protein/permease [Nonomuraea soli]MBA2890756.1 ABC-type branched-subunit amino acid transport system ATPase component/ABC-type branched-subunit amino acid transport system permease subunit [Nonomuraea soli]
MSRPLTAASAATAVTTAAVVALLLAWPFITDFYSYNAQYYDGLVASAAIAAVLTISLNLAMGYGGMLSMAHTGLQLLGGYGTAFVAVKAGLPWPVGLGLAVVLSAVLSALLLLVSLRATYLYFGMITLAANLIVIEIGREWDDVTGGINGITGIDPGMAKRAFYYVVVAALIVAYLVQRNFVRSSAGRAAMAVRESPESASAMGIRPATTKLLTFSVAGGLAGLSGGLYALQLGFINPDVGLLDNGLVFFVGLFLGGIGTLAGPLLGVAFITVIVELGKDHARYTTLILGVALLVSMMVIPRGIVGTWQASRFGRPKAAPDAGGDPETSQVPASVGSGDRPPDRDVPALEGRGLVKHFGGVRALDGVDIAVQAGTVHGVIGPNGSGKSTLVSCLTRFYRADEGEVLIFGEPAPAASWAVPGAGVTRVFQVPHLFERQSVLDNVLTGIRTPYSWVSAVLRLPSCLRAEREARAFATELLAFAGLAARASFPADSLSHGQKRLLEVVRAVATRPRVLILDEPATGLVPGEIDALARLCAALRERGLAVVLIEHNVEFVMKVCDEVTVIETGRVIARGAPAQVRADPAVLAAYLGRPDLVESS